MTLIKDFIYLKNLGDYLDTEHDDNKGWENNNHEIKWGALCASTTVPPKNRSTPAAHRAPCVAPKPLYDLLFTVVPTRQF